MGMAIRLQDPVTKEMYSFDPQRDIAYFWPQLVQLAITGLKEKNWEVWYAGYAKEHKLTEDDLIDTLRAYCLFCELSLETDIATPKAALEQSGFFGKPVAAQLVVMAKMGQLCTGAFWAGIRYKTAQGVVPEAIKAIKDAASQLEKQVPDEWAAAN